MKNIEVFHLTHKTALNLQPHLSLIRKNRQASFSLLIDDYNFPHSLALIPEEIRSHLNVIAFEKTLVPLAESILAKLATTSKNNSIYLKNSNIRLQKGDRLACCLLTAAWYLCRLGHLPFPPQTIINNFTPASGLINLLGQQYEATEKKTLVIIQQYLNKSVDNIEYIFYKEGEKEYESI